MITAHFILGDRSSATEFADFWERMMSGGDVHEALAMSMTFGLVANYQRYKCDD